MPEYGIVASGAGYPEGAGPVGRENAGLKGEVAE